MAPSKEHFRKAMSRFATGVTVITTTLDGEMHGMTANAVTSLSLDPMLLLVCVDKNADSHDILSKAGVFAVNILSESQADLSNRFAKKEFDGAHDMDDVPHSIAESGAPIIDGAIAYIDCRTITEHHGGDHTIFIGEVLDARELNGAAPLLFYTAKYSRLQLD
jgi:flavin reductase (DIM6/NTAB) family NADH-FMN oxidoreductase RutF